MFTCRCFIRKNTSELRNKLKELGHTICICTEFNDARWLTINPQAPYTVHGVGYTSEEMPWKSSEEVLENFEDEAKQRDIVDCGTNEELFLAIAALRDDTDKSQWFVLDTDLSFSPNANGIEHPIGSFIKCGRDKWNIDFNDDGTPCEFSSRNIPAHKATVQELIEHFQNK